MLYEVITAGAVDAASGAGFGGQPHQATQTKAGWLNFPGETAVPRSAPGKPAAPAFCRCEIRNNFV